jgi:signal transduction histidine kinase
MRELLTRVRTALGSDTATILSLKEDGIHLAPISSDGVRENVVEDVQIPLGRGVAGRIAESEIGMIFPNLTEEEVQSLFLRDRVKSLVGAPLRVGGRLIGVVHVGSSAARQFSEDDLHLLRLVADRVAVAIERARLHEAERVARREAEAANRAKDEFLAVVSHEPRQPLNAIVGWSHAVRAGKRDEVTLSQAFEVIERNAKLQEHLINDLLDVSRSITGRLRLEIQPVDLRGVIGTSIDVVRPAAEAKRIRLETVLDASASLVSGDADRLQQVLWNLLSNAIKFTPRGGRIEVRLRRVDSQAELTVSDTGEGISAQLLPHVFERFVQAGGVEVRAPGGLGLGLAIVRHLVELHGEPDARELLRTVLEECGAVVKAAGSAAEALEVLQRQSPEVLICDIAMPGEDGYALIRKVRALPPERGGCLPAVAVTAHARTDDRTRALLAGFQLHVPKPVEAAELVAVVASLLGRTAHDPLS